VNHAIKQSVIRAGGLVRSGESRDQTERDPRRRTRSER
jgi:hypothetical protein